MFRQWSCLSSLIRQAGSGLSITRTGGLLEAETGHGPNGGLVEIEAIGLGSSGGINRILTISGYKNWRRHPGAASQ
jgi:hypothetical protein